VGSQECPFGLAVLVLGGVWTIVTLRAHPLADALGTAVALLSAICAWRYWLRASTLPRSRLIAHAFLEEPGVAVRRARIKGGLLR